VIPKIDSEIGISVYTTKFPGCGGAIKKQNDDYIFKVVDINRMEFKSLSFDQCIRNFNKLWAKDSDLIVVLTQYAKISNNNIDECLQIGLKYHQNHKNKINMKKRLKGIEVVD